MVANRGSAYECASLPDVVTDALALIAVANEYPQIRLTQRLSPDAEFVTGDRVQIQQVMINLVRNACDAASESAYPAVTIVSERCSEDHVKVSVTDNGPGIPASLGDLFSPFSTSKKTGLGLGLSISRTIVEAHGGRIWVESNSDAGTTMSFTIPTERLELAVAS